MPADLMPVEQAKARILDQINALESETVPLSNALGKFLVEDIVAKISHPAQAISAMDGYALHIPADKLEAGASLEVVGEAAAGHPFEGSLREGEAVRIFTGGYLPQGSHGILIQEDAHLEHGKVTLHEAVSAGQFVRPEGLDFKAGAKIISKGQQLNARAFALAALSGAQECVIRRQPKIAIISSGDELIPFGQNPEAGKLINSNSLYLKTLVNASGGSGYDLGIIADKKGALLDSLESATAKYGKFDLIISSGGASVGTHDHIYTDLKSGKDIEMNFWKIAMRPGKPLMFATHQGTPFIGLPGNPVSAGVCALVFVLPALQKLLGIQTEQPHQTATLSAELKENDRRQDFLRAKIELDPSGQRFVTPMIKQDSSMLANFMHADALIIRPPHAPPASSGDMVPIMTIPDGL